MKLLASVGTKCECIVKIVKREENSETPVYNIHVIGNMNKRLSSEIQYGGLLIGGKGTQATQNVNSGNGD